MRRVHCFVTSNQKAIQVPETESIVAEEKLAKQKAAITMISQYLQCKTFITVVPVGNQIFKNYHVGVQKPLKCVPISSVTGEINGINKITRATRIVKLTLQIEWA